MGLSEQLGFVLEGDLWKRNILHEDLAGLVRPGKAKRGALGMIPASVGRRWLLSGILWLPGDECPRLVWVAQGSSCVQAAERECQYLHSISSFHQKPLKPGKGGRWGRMSSLVNLGDGGFLRSCKSHFRLPWGIRAEACMGVSCGGLSVLFESTGFTQHHDAFLPGDGAMGLTRKGMIIGATGRAWRCRGPWQL